MSALTSGYITIVVAIVGILYILSIAFVFKDSRERSAYWIVWSIFGLIPLVGFLVYLLMRPQATTEDRNEQAMDVALRQRQLMQYGDCPHCGYPTEADYVLCPYCHTRLKNLCPKCHHALNAEWTVCPYCATTMHTSGLAPYRAPSASRRSRTESASSRKRTAEAEVTATEAQEQA